MTARCVGIALLSAAALCAQAPISIKLTAAKPRVLTGEGIVLHIQQTVTAPLQMETVELNRDRTTVTIRPAVGAAKSLSGKDYVALHRRPALGQIGRAFTAPAGRTWQSELNLLDYSRPLPAGRYRISIAYRWGEGPSAVVRSDEAAVEVASATMDTLTQRWFGGTTPEDRLGLLWTADDRGKRHLLFTVAENFDPSVAITSVDLGPTTATSPELAYIPGIADDQAYRSAVWVSGGRICWERFTDAGLVAGASSYETGLDATQPIRLADPPLQRENGGLAAVLTGMKSGGPEALLFDGAAHEFPIRATGPAVVIWKAEPSRAAGALYVASPHGLVLRADIRSGAQEELRSVQGAKVALTQNQTLDKGTVFALLSRPAAVDVRRCDPQPGPPVTFPQGCDIQQAVAGTHELGPAMLCRTAQGFAILSSAGIKSLGAQPGWLVASANSFFLLRYVPQQGFTATTLNADGAKEHR